MEFPISISRTSRFLILGVLGGIFHFYSNSYRTFCEQTVETLIRCRVLRRLIWVCAVCLCPTKKEDGVPSHHVKAQIGWFFSHMRKVVLLTSLHSDPVGLEG